MYKDKFEVGDLVTAKSPSGLSAQGTGLVIAPHSLTKPDGWMVYWFKYAELDWWYEYHLTKL